MHDETEIPEETAREEDQSAVNIRKIEAITVRFKSHSNTIAILLISISLSMYFSFRTEKLTCAQIDVAL